jgi:hypothetical protein
MLPHKQLPFILLTTLAPLALDQPSRAPRRQIPMA